MKMTPAIWIMIVEAISDILRYFINLQNDEKEVSHEDNDYR